MFAIREKTQLNELDELNIEYTKYIKNPAEFPDGMANWFKWKDDIEEQMDLVIREIKDFEKYLALGTAFQLSFDELSTEIAFIKNKYFGGTFNNPDQVNNKIDIQVQNTFETINHQYYGLIVFRDGYGTNVKLDNERVGIVFSWDELLNKPDNPIRNYVGGNSIGDYLLMNPFTTEFSSSNPVIDWALLEGVSQYDPDPDIQNEFDLASQWSLDNVELASSLFSRPEQRIAWKMYLNNKGYSEKVISFIDNQKQFDVLHPENNDCDAVSAFNAIGHEYNMLLFEFKKWIVDLLNNHDYIFKKWDESNLELSDIWENFKFKGNGKIKAWYDGCELTYDGLKQKQVVSLAFTDFVSFEYLNGTTDWSYTSMPWSINGYNSNIESKMAQITQEGLRHFATGDVKNANKFYGWIVGNVFSICGII